MGKTQLFRSIRFKIALAFFVVFMLISAVTSSLLYVFLKRTLEEAHKSSLLVEANGIVENTGYDPIQIPLTNTDQWVYIWYESDFARNDMYQKPGFPYTEDLVWSWEDPQADSLASDSFISDTITYVLVERPLFNAENGQISLILAKQNKGFHAQLLRVRSNMLLANVLALLVSMVLAYVVSGYSLRPVQAIIGKAREIKAGPKMDRLPVSGSGDEIAQLSNTINQMIARIESSIKDQNHFFASAAHELRTPLANMQSELEYRITTNQNPQLNQSLQSIRDEVIRLKNVVQDFLLVSQLKNENMELRQSKLRMDDLVYDVLEKLKPSLSKSGIEIKLQLDEGLEPIFGDSDKIESLILNLIDNATKYGENSIPIQISLAAQEDMIELIVQNAISEQDKQVKGHGLGLWVCARIADLHGFHFKAENEGQNFGASLKIPINALS